MKCSEVSERLAQGKPLDGAARAHVAECEICRALAELAFTPAQTLEAAHIESYKRVVGRQLTAVRPIASDRQLTFLLVGLFFCFSVAAAFPVGYGGARVLTASQMALYYGVIVISALFGASVLVQEAVPGARRYLDTRAALTVEALVLVGTVALLFRSLSMARFVASGLTCLLLGLACAAASGTLIWFVLRDGWFISPLRAGAVAGFFAGLSGFGVLAMHCPVLSTPHILVWHFGVVPAGMLAGAAIGYLGQKIQVWRNF